MMSEFSVCCWLFCSSKVCLRLIFSVVLYALSAVYFAGVMVRLMLTLTPVVCILSGIAFSGLLELFLREDDMPRLGDSSDAEEDQAVGGSRRLYDKVSYLFKKPTI